jgi:hypothetical protein
MSIVLMGSTSGSCTLQEQAVAGTTTLTLPTTSGTVALTSDIVAPTTAQVLTATAGASAGAVGTYGFFGYTPVTAVALNTTVAGSTLVPAGVIRRSDDIGAPINSGSAQSGTWRCMGYSPTGSGALGAATVWLRIS